METIINNNSYCTSLTRYERWLTREIFIGDVPLGANHPIRVQSMTTTDTMDTKATVEQSIRMIEAGCEFVRITAPSINEAKNLEIIKNELRKRGYKSPLIADIHFTPNAAEAAARVVEKVRVNPGNYADRKKFEVKEYSDEAYQSELERIRERFLPLVRVCREYGTAMRIGTNHGSLSDRIMNRYGDTPLGMVESAMEFLRICEDENYHSIVLSMKASNPLVMVQAYRLLVAKMKEEGMNYPLHLGVTEAGEGEDGRIKSASGIGTLLEDGIGDTIRVSLTEEPEFEIPVARALVERYQNRAVLQKPIPEILNLNHSPFKYRKRETIEVENFGGGHNVPRVVADFSGKKSIAAADIKAAGYFYSEKLDKWNLSDQPCDYIFAGENKIDFEIPGTLGIIYNYEAWKPFKNKPRSYPFFTFNEFRRAGENSDKLNFVEITIEDISHPGFKDEVSDFPKVVFVFSTTNEHGMAELRRMFFEMEFLNLKNPVIIKRAYHNISENNFQLYASTDCGALLLDGFGDGLWLSAENVSEKIINSTSFGILQSARVRISKTEYISCPSCGRTLFDLQETTAKIRSRTNHLKGLKIGIMGCIVNGPGEMADADYGYVGTGPGKITLYKGKDVVIKNIPTEKAVDALINLIRENGDWVEKE